MKDPMMQAWTFNQLAKLRQYRPDLVDPAIEEMLTLKENLRWHLVVGGYLDGEINLGKAAELLGMHRLDLQKRFLSQGIPLRIGSETIEEAQAEIDSIAQWNDSLEPTP
jgi:predicted HTH domain antitoxin